MNKQTLKLVNGPNYKISVHVQEPDRFSHKHSIEIETTVYDERNKSWSLPRSTKLFLNDAEMMALGNFLNQQSLFYPDTHMGWSCSC